MIVQIRRNWEKKYWIMFLPLLLIAAVILIKGVGLTINISPSMKIGLYIKSGGAITPGDVVSVCLVEPYKTIAIERNYIGKGRRCHGTEPLIKEVIATPGDNVFLADEYIRVNQNKYLFRTQYFDSLNRKLDIYPRGKYLHTQGYWLIGVNNKNSWDSRYFGPVSGEQILSKLRPLVVWR